MQKPKTYAQKYAQELLVKWLRNECELAGDDSYVKSSVIPPISWRVNRQAPFWGVFPDYPITGHISHDSAARILREACKQVGIIGVSTHSFRRTALTQMSNAGIPLRVIQEISGHRNLEQLQKYLEVSDEQVLGAAASLAMLSPVGENVGKYNLDDIKPKAPKVKYSVPD
jgi:integrase